MKIICACLGLAILAIYPGIGVNAQIIPDDTLPENTSVDILQNNISISGGTKRGGNLFHSFREFNLNTGETAIFNNQDESVRNIFSSVSGDGISFINGNLLSPSTANLFLINTNGFIFGNDVSTNINSSLFVTTASSLVFEDGMFLSSNPSSSNLERLIFNNSGDIIINGTGHSITFANPENPVVSSLVGLGESTNGLRGAFGRDIVLLGRDITLDGGVVTSPSGNIFLGSIQNGEVNIDLTGSTQLNFNNVISYGNVFLTNLALLDTSGVLDSNIVIQSNDLTLSNAAAIYNANFGESTLGTGSIDIRAAQDVRVSALDSPEVLFRFINDGISISGGINSQNYSSGQAANIDIEARNLFLENLGLIGSIVFGSGQGGNLNVNVSDTITLSSEALFQNILGGNITVSSLTTNSFNGPSGSLSISANELNILGGSLLINQVAGPFDGSDINIVVTNNINISGGLIIDPSTNSFLNSSLATSSLGSSNAGSLFLTANSINIVDGGQIVSQPGPIGNSGNITLNADSLNISGRIPNSAEDSSSANSGVRASVLQINPFLVGIFDILPIPQGNTGEININANTININNQGTITVANDGIGDGGIISVNSAFTRLESSGSISAQTFTGDGGDIFINSDILLLDDSSITANSVNSSGGNIDINSTAFFRSSDSSISASSTAGPRLDGNVTITSPVTDLGRATTIEETTIGFTPFPDLCKEIVETSSSLINEGSGRVQGQSIDYVEATLIWHRGSTSGSVEYIHPTTGEIISYTRVVGWVVHPDGRISLTSTPSESIQHKAGELPCSVATEQLATTTSSNHNTPYLVAQQLPSTPDIRPTPPPQQPIPPSRPSVPEIKITPPEAPPNPPKRLGPSRIRIGKFVIEGNTVISTEDINALLQPFLDRELTTNDLRNIERTITSTYVERGYITSLAILDESRNQLRNPLNDGIVLTVVEGTISDIKIFDAKRYESFIKKRIAPGHSGIFNQAELQKALRLLLLDIRIDALNVGISPDIHLGKSFLNIDIDPGNEVRLSVSYNNYRSPSIGTQQRSIKLSHLNLVGQGDTLSLNYRNTDGSNTIQAQYRYPVDAKNSNINLFYQYSASNIIEEPFDSLDISGESHFAQIGYRQPLIRRANPDIVQELALSATLSYENSRLSSSLIPFPITTGSDEDGRTQIAALRLSQDYYQQQKSSYLAAKSQFSIGLGGTDISSSPDGQFISWRGQALWARQLPHNLVFLMSGDLQLSDQPLLASEQFALGGNDKGRGFRPNSLLSDNGVFGSISLLIPIYNGRAGKVSIFPFFDIGTSWTNNNIISTNSQTIASTGIGISYKIANKLDASIEWGIPLTGRPISTRTPQEDGVNFSLTWHVF